MLATGEPEPPGDCALAVRNAVSKACHMQRGSFLGPPARIPGGRSDLARPGADLFRKTRVRITGFTVTRGRTGAPDLCIYRPRYSQKKDYPALLAHRGALDTATTYRSPGEPFPGRGCSRATCDHLARSPGAEQPGESCRGLLAARRPSGEMHEFAAGAGRGRNRVGRDQQAMFALE